jgi:hypothetical protein
VPIRIEKHEIIGYRQEKPDGQFKIRDKHGELVGMRAFGQTIAKNGRLIYIHGTVVIDVAAYEPQRSHNREDRRCRLL